ncbi:MAG: protein kinase [Myxococcales bacterium]|nr:protein kinase [Myxococcales bacterium]MBK7192191.1 protein kinase [Myxococcales bacterium]
MSEDRRLAQSTAAWSGAGDDVSPAVGDAPTVDGRPPAVRGTAGQALADGRYQILGELGRGGMAVVHAAFDRQLGRRVALKLVRPDRVDAAGRARLLREAQAMARLHHRNVVQVFDAGSAGDHVFVAMELVDGGSLHRWLVTAPRSWRQIVELFVGAGRGLAAAHAAGLVHRDFKPDNVLVDAHGVARVADFGLAVAGADHERGDGDAVALASVTSTGVLIGTPAYMAPEQLDGRPATAAADQFAFCVALHRALHGIAPFAGDTPTALRERIAAGAPDESDAGRALPRWLRAAVARGLAIRPADRHASMAALLDVLARLRGWRKWRVPIIGGVAVAATATAVVLAAVAPPTTDPSAACDGGRDELTAVWNPARRAALVNRFTTATADVRDLVFGTLQRHAEAWTTMHRRACVAHARGSESAQTLDQRMRCLRQRRVELDAAVDTIAGIENGDRRQAVDVTANLAPIDDCGNLELLARELPPPASLDVRRRSDALRSELARLEAADRVGHPEAALAGLTNLIREARSIDDPSLLIDALLAHGRIAQVRMEYGPAVIALHEAEQLALAHGATRAGIEAGARRLFVEAMDGQRLDALSAQAELLEPLAQSLTGDHFAVPLLLNNLGAMHMARGDTAKARGYFERAKALVDAIPEPRLELLVVDRNLGLTTGGAVSERLAQQTLRKLQQRLGADNPTTIEAATTSSHLTRDPREALAIADDFIARTAALQPGAIEIRLDEARYAAFLALELGDVARARACLEPAVAFSMAGASELIVAIHRLAVADIALLDGRIDAARDAYTAANRVLLSSPNWWDREYGAAALVGLATIARRGGDDATAAQQLDRAIAIYVEVTGNGNNQDPMRRLARARLERAALARAHGDAALADQLETAALVYYRSTESPAYADVIARHGREPQPAPPAP